MKKTVFQMNEVEKQRDIEVIGTTVQMLEEGRAIFQIAQRLNLHGWQVSENIDEILYIIRKRIGLWRFIKTIFIK